MPTRPVPFAGVDVGRFAHRHDPVGEAPKERLVGGDERHGLGQFVPGRDGRMDRRDAACFQAIEDLGLEEWLAFRPSMTMLSRCSVRRPRPSS